MVQVLSKRCQALAWHADDLRGVPKAFCQHKIHLKESCKPIIQPCRRLNETLRKVIHDEIMKIWRAKIIYPVAYSDWISPIVVVPKKNGKWQFCVDYKKLNEYTEKDHFPLPYVDQILDQIASNEFYYF